MNRSKTPASRTKKLFALLVAVFTLCNFIIVLPASASGISSQSPSASASSPSFCIPTFFHRCKTPTPTPAPTHAPAPTATPTQCAQPCTSPTPSPSQTPSPTPTRHPPQLSLSGSFTLAATRIVGTNAHLDITDILHPVLSFTSATIEGLKITHLSITLNAPGTATSSGVAIKTSVFQDLVTALGSFANKGDLLALLAGATVKTLVLNNPTLQVDRFIQIQSLAVSNLSFTAN